MNSRVLICAALLTTAAMCSCSFQQPAQASTRTDEDISHGGSIFTLLGWRSTTGNWYFILRTEEEFDASAKHDVKHRLSGVAALKDALARLPQGTGVFWSNSRVFGYEYPPDRIAEDVRAFAKRRGINLQYNPALE
jgi:hypothetical protein